MFERIKKLFRRKDNPNKKSMPNSYPTPSVPAGTNNQFLDDMMIVNSVVITSTFSSSDEFNECGCDTCSPSEPLYNEHDGSDSARDDSPSYESSHSSDDVGNTYDSGSSYDSSSSCDCGGGGCGGD